MLLRHSKTKNFMLSVRILRSRGEGWGMGSASGNEQNLKLICLLQKDFSWAPRS